MEIHLGKLIFHINKCTYIKYFYWIIIIIDTFLFFPVLSMTHWRHLSVCSERKMKEIDVWENTEEEAEHDLGRVAILDRDRALLVADHHLRLVLVDHAVHHRNEDHRDHRCHSDLVVVLQNVDHEVVASPLAGIFKE